MALVHTGKNPGPDPRLLKNETYDVILLDMNFARGQRRAARRASTGCGRILAADPLAVVILITAYGDVGMAVRAIKEGATDFILKPWQNEKLLATLSAALSLGPPRRGQLAPASGRTTSAPTSTGPSGIFWAGARR